MVLFSGSALSAWFEAVVPSRRQISHCFQGRQFGFGIAEGVFGFLLASVVIFCLNGLPTFLHACLALLRFPFFSISSRSLPCCRCALAAFLFLTASQLLLSIHGWETLLSHPPDAVLGMHSYGVIITELNTFQWSPADLQVSNFSSNGSQ